MAKKSTNRMAWWLAPVTAAKQREGETPMKSILSAASIGLAAILGGVTMAGDYYCRAAPDPRGAGGEWRLVWADEFETNGPPDQRRWSFERGFVRNHELQWYQPENAWCEGGRLIIEGRRERKRKPNYSPNSRDWRANQEYADYTSACLTTRGHYNWQYGRFEMKGRIDTRPGLWPAFWTLGVEGEWPRCGEVDIMEYYRGWLLANAAWGTDQRWTPRWASVRKPIADLPDPDWAAKFHVWRMDWDPREIQLSVDGMVLNTVDLDRTIHQDSAGTPGDEGTKRATGPFHQPHYVLLNLAIGGTNGGDPSKTRFPARFEVEYVRVYQRLQPRR
jgi:beta-glucanase (GH16 family)